MATSVITLTYNKSKLMQACVQSVIRRRKELFQWVIVDNGTDDTGEILKSMALTPAKVTYLKHDNSGNFSSMNNSAARQAQGDILVFLNNDVEVRSDFITEIEKTFSERPDVGIVGGVLRHPNGNLQHAGVIIDSEVQPGNLGALCVAAMGLDRYCLTPENWPSETYFQAVTGACLAIRKADFFAIGGFHSEFSWCFEDVDLCFRMTKWLKKAVVVNPKVQMMHRESQSGGARHVDFNYNLLRGRWKGHIMADSWRFKTKTTIERLHLPGPKKSEVVEESKTLSISSGGNINQPSVST